MKLFSTRNVLAAAVVATATSVGTADAATFNVTLDGIDFTFVEADAFAAGGTAGNTVNAASPATAWSSTSSSGSDNLWRERPADGFLPDYSAFVGSQNISFEAFGNDRTNAPELQTSITGLDAGEYDVFAVYLVRNDGLGGAAAVLADLNASATTVRSLATVDHVLVDGATADPSTIWSFALSKLGTTSDDATSFTVNAKGLVLADHNRSDYVGVAYTVVPEPSSLALLGLGGLLIARRRRA